MASIITMLDQMKDMVVESVANNSRIKEVSPTLRALETTVEQQTAASSEQITTYGMEINQLMNEMSAKLNDCDGSMKEIDANAMKMIAVNREKDEEMISQVNAMHTAFGEQKNQMSSQLDEMLHEIGNINEMTEINIDAGLNKLINECGDEQERIDASLHQFNEMHANLESIHKDYLGKMTDDLKVCAQRLNSFQKEEVQIYQPTGQTPSKREYSYPRILAATSPHAKIIKDYWRQHSADTTLDCSAIISEEPRLLTETVNGNAESVNESSTLINMSAYNTTQVLCESQAVNASSTPYIRGDFIKSTKSSMFEGTPVIAVSGITMVARCRGEFMIFLIFFAGREQRKLTEALTEQTTAWRLYIR